MLKRIFTFLLTLALIVTVCPFVMPARAISLDHFTGTLGEVYDAFAASIYQPLADENAIDQLLEPALYGNGSTVVFDEQDAVTAAIFESKLYREAFMGCIAQGVSMMQEEGLKEIMMDGSVNWYDFSMSYSTVTQFVTESGPKFGPANEKSLYYSIDSIKYTGATNRCDSALVLVAGGCTNQILIRELETTADTATYHLTVQITDIFNFDGSYDHYSKKGYDTSLAKMLTILGPLLGLNDFTWYTRTEFVVTLPIACDHDDAGTFRWEVQGSDLTAVSGEGLSINNIYRQTYTNFNSITGASSTVHYYKLEKPLHLLHTDPWYVEFKVAGTTNLYLGAGTMHRGSPIPSLYKYHDRVTVSDAHIYRALNKQGKMAIWADRDTYGADFVKAGIKKSGLHVFRLENRPNADGTNMIWLLVDGVEIGPLVSKELINGVTSKITQLGEDTTWVSGKDYLIRYIFNRNVGFRNDLNKEYYVQIGTAGGDYWTDTYVEPSCTSSGGAAHQCKLCGLTLVNTPGQPLPHTPKTVPGYAPSCTEEGLTEGSVCADCGEVLVVQEVIPTLAHTPMPIPAVEATCKFQGLTEGSKCADCGKVLVHQEAIPATGHVFEAMPSKPATCTEEGSSGGSWCPTCEKILMPATTLPALGHNFKNGKCKNCGEADPDVPVLMGDTDGDGAVTYMDAMAALQMAVGLLESDPVCDMDADSAVTYLDAMQILRLAVGLA